MLCDYFAGWVSGVVSLIIGHPLDTIKIQQQVYGLTFTEAASRIKKQRGWKGYYRGILVPVLATGTLNALFFGIYGDVRDFLIRTRSKREWAVEQALNAFGDRKDVQDRQIILQKEVDLNRNMALAGFDETYHKRVNNEKNREAKFSELFISGATAGIGCLFLAVPAELVKTKLQSQMKRRDFKGPFHCFMTIVRESGFRGIYRGIMPMALRNAIGAEVSLIALCQYLKSCERKDSVRSNSIWKLFMANGVAGICAWTLILPFDTIKSRMQADSHAKPHYKSMAHCAKEVLRADGIKGLYRGFWSCIARAVPVNAAIFVVYELIQDLIC